MHRNLNRVLILLVASISLACSGFGQLATGIPPHGKLVRLFNGKDLPASTYCFNRRG